ncbi:sensor histidine kinase [Bacillus sp. 1P06AnD]|uniref:sensor histidine kinase n=1 Tax=Bacillus sp. 1P06AnD TaxID=3132208 RepID=UPI00399F5080
MKTLYHRIIVTTFVVMLGSSTLAFIISNAYFQYNLKPQNDKKVTRMASDIADFYHDNPEVSPRDYFDSVGKLGYQLYLTGKDNEGTFYGGSFRVKHIDQKVISKVISGEIYHGIANFPSSVFITGFFDNTLANTVGVPITIDGQKYALFVRSDTEVQFGELRVFFALLMALTAIFSIMAFVVNTRYIVKPITKLTAATKKIAKGQYDIQLQVNRNDEIGALGEQFSKMANELRQVEAMRQEFVSNVSHEIQTPLSSIKGYANMLQDDQINDEHRKKYLSIIESESARLSQLSRQLLVLASLDKEDHYLDKREFNLSDQIKQVVSMTEWAWRDKEMMLELDLEPVTYKGDQQLLYQVWANLITNSIKYSNEGGSLYLAVRSLKGSCSVVIKDTGIGISKEELPHIFTRFYKADKARSRSNENSSGLGLAIVKKIIDLHGGQILVDSELGKGTTFQILLPKCN